MRKTDIGARNAGHRRTKCRVAPRECNDAFARRRTFPSMRPDGSPTRILFLCLGNICRSPAAEGIFIHRARERGVLDRLRAMSSFRPDAGPDDVADPYEHGPEAFVAMFDHLERAVDGMLDELAGGDASRSPGARGPRR
jgi:hypothetical protein